MTREPGRAHEPPPKELFCKNLEREVREAVNVRTRKGLGAINVSHQIGDEVVKPGTDG